MCPLLSSGKEPRDPGLLRTGDSCVLILSLVIPHRGQPGEHHATSVRLAGMTAGAFETVTELDPGETVTGIDPVNHRDLLIADLGLTRARIESLERDWRGIVESAAMTSADDEHDP